VRLFYQKSIYLSIFTAIETLYSPLCHQRRGPKPSKAMAVPTLMMAVPAFFARLAGAPDEPAVLFSREFFGRAYSMSNDGWVMTWASLALTSC
jgi:hypothetical protein